MQTEYGDLPEVIVRAAREAEQEFGNGSGRLEKATLTAAADELDRINTSRAGALPHEGV
jgi:hypothetical protein